MQLPRVLVLIVISALNSECRNNLTKSEKILLLSQFGDPSPSTPSTETYSSNTIENGPARRFLQQYRSRNPVILLVDDTRESHEDAETFLKSVYELSPSAERINFMLMRFDKKGVSPVLETTFNNRDRLEGLLREKITRTPSSNLGLSATEDKAAVFFGVLNAAQKLPRDGGIVIFMKRGIEDESLAAHASEAIAKNNIRIFVVWGGGKKVQAPYKGGDKLLKQFAEYSGGDFVVSHNGRDLSDEHYGMFLENTPLSSVSSVLSRKHLSGSVNIAFPIDSDVTAIHVSITPNVTGGVLITPGGVKIDVTRRDEVSRFSWGSFLIVGEGLHEVHLNTTTATTPSVGVWRMRLENGRTYSVAVFAHSKITTDAFITYRNYTDGGHEVAKPNTGTRRRKIMKLGLTGDVGKIKNISFVTRDGQPIRDNVKFTLGTEWQAENLDIETINKNKELNVDVDSEAIPEGPFYAVVNGKDSRGHDFTRLSYVKQYRDNTLFNLPPVTVEIGLDSEVITQPNRQPRIYFEVTNNGNRPVLVRFACRDEKSILLAMDPPFKWISPQETSTVRVTLTTISRPGAIPTGTSFTDLITFRADTGSEVFEKSVQVDVGRNSHADDRKEPDLDYHFTSDCLNVLLGKCEGGTWTVEVKARDSDSGLLQVTSRPKGLYFPTQFTTGTREQVTGYYSESCCNADLQIVAVDRAYNRRQYDINAYRATLGPGAIAAIVLGVLLLILLIALLVWIIRRLCLKPTKESYDLPTYRGPASSKRANK